MNFSAGSKLRSYDESNLRCARIILADRAKYDKPDARFVITWAEAVLKRLGATEEKQSAA